MNLANAYPAHTVSNPATLTRAIHCCQPSSHPSLSVNVCRPKGRKGCEATEKPYHDYGTHEIVDEKALLHQVEQEAGEKQPTTLTTNVPAGNVSPKRLATKPESRNGQSYKAIQPIRLTEFVALI